MDGLDPLRSRSSDDTEDGKTAGVWVARTYPTYFVTAGGLGHQLYPLCH